MCQCAVNVEVVQTGGANCARRMRGDGSLDQMIEGVKLSNMEEVCKDVESDNTNWETV